MHTKYTSASLACHEQEEIFRRPSFAGAAVACFGGIEARAAISVVEESGFSQDPTDRLIRELIRTRREATSEEVERIVNQMATASFMGPVRVPPRDRGLSYQGRTVLAREDSLFYHLAKRVGEGQWRSGTAETEYLRDLRDAISDPDARLVVYAFEGGHFAAILADNNVPETRLGDEPEEYVFVVYLANRGRIFSGYQASGIGTINISENPLWLK